MVRFDIHLIAASRSSLVGESLDVPWGLRTATLGLFNCGTRRRIWVPLTMTLLSIIGVVSVLWGRFSIGRRCHSHRSCLFFFVAFHRISLPHHFCEQFGNRALSLPRFCSCRVRCPGLHADRPRGGELVGRCRLRIFDRINLPRQWRCMVSSGLFVVILPCSSMFFPCLQTWPPFPELKPPPSLEVWWSCGRIAPVWERTQAVQAVLACLDCLYQGSLRFSRGSFNQEVLKSNFHGIHFIHGH